MCVCVCVYTKNDQNYIKKKNGQTHHPRGKFNISLMNQKDVVGYWADVGLMGGYRPACSPVKHTLFFSMCGAFVTVHDWTFGQAASPTDDSRWLSLTAWRDCDMS